MKIACVIPARYASSRLPGKPLALIAEKPMIQWVYEKAMLVREIDKVIVATDNKKIFDVVEKFGGNAVMTSPELPSGTDRVFEAIKNDIFDVVINLQGDEPFVEPDLLAQLVRVFDDKNINIATPICRIDDEKEIIDPNVVCVVRDINGFALYFSRSQIPFFRDQVRNNNTVDGHIFYKHIGIYAYRFKCLEELTKLRESPLEKSEKLEQLRFLENGFRIFTIITDYNSISVDTPADLKTVNSMLQKQLNH